VKFYRPDGEIDKADEAAISERWRLQFTRPEHACCRKPMKNEQDAVPGGQCRFVANGIAALWPGTDF
jgi:hypothetical protein